MNLLKLLVVVSLMIMFLCVLGFVCDVIVVRIFGVGMVIDVFFVVFKFFNLLCWIFVEGVFF